MTSNERQLPEDLLADMTAVSLIAAVPKILEVVCRVTGMGFAAVARVTDDRWVACAVLDQIAFGVAVGGELDLRTTLCHEVRLSNESIVIDHAAADERYGTHHSPMRYRFQSYLSVPIHKVDGTFFGTLCAIDPKPRSLRLSGIVDTVALFADLIASHLSDPQLHVPPMLARRQSVEPSEARFHELVERMPHFVWSANTAGEALYQNAGWYSFTGQTFADTQNGGWLDVMHPDDRPRLEEAWTQAVQTGSDYDTEARLRRASDGAYRWFRLKGAPIRDSNNDLVRWAGTCTDIHDARTLQQTLGVAEQRQRFLLHMGDRLRALSDPIEIQLVAARMLREYLAADGVGYAEDRGDSDHVVVTHHHVCGVPSIEGIYRYEDYGPALLRELRAGRAVIRPDIPHDPLLTEAERAAHAALLLGATLAVPIAKGGSLRSLLFAHHRVPHAWTDEEVGLAHDVAERTWAAVEAGRAQAALETRNRQLDLLAHTSQRMLNSWDSDDALVRAVATDIASLVEMESFVHHRVSDEPGLLRLTEQAGITDPERRLFATMGFGERLCGRVAETRQHVIVEDLQRSTELGSDAFREAGATSYAGFPLVADGRLLGTIAFLSRRRTHLRDGDAQTVQAVCDQLASALERGRAVEALRISQARLAAAFEALPSGVGIVDLDGRFVLSNHQLLRYLPSGVVPSRDLGRLLRWRAWHADGALVEPNDFPAARALRGETVVPGLEMLCRQDDGTELWTQVATVPVREDGGQIIGVATVITDIDKLKQAEAVLRESEERLRRLNEQLEDRVRDRTAEIEGLFSRLITAQEEERRRIARDVHDQLGQQLTALRMNIEMLRSLSKQHPALHQQADRTQRLAEELDQSVDFLTWQLRPAALDHLGLSAALRNLASGWTERFGVEAEFDAEDIAELGLTRDVEANLYRIAQEALHNVAKHADATHATLQLTRRGGCLMLMIEDDGRGFEPTTARQHEGGGGLGLISMRERAALVGGHLEIESGPDRGTSIRVRIPQQSPTHDRH